MAQDKYWFKPTQHMYLVLFILTCCAPFLSVGICSRFFPDRLESFPKSYYQVLWCCARSPNVENSARSAGALVLSTLRSPCLLACQVLCSLSNVKPRVKDYYAILGVDPEDDQKAIKRVFRKLSIELHPDKVGDDKEKLQRFNEVRKGVVNPKL